MPPLPIDSAATALFQTWVALLSPIVVVSFVFHAAGLIELQDFPVIDMTLSIPHLGRSTDLTSASPIRGASPDMSSLTPDPGSGVDLGPITTRQATDINGAGGWDDTAGTRRDYPTSISQGSLFRERARGTRKEIVRSKLHAA